MEAHERSRYRAAAFRATRLYPGPVGYVLQREILCWEDFGYLLSKDGIIEQLVNHIMKTPLPELKPIPHRPNGYE
jgi:hypothetical protein